MDWRDMVSDGFHQLVIMSKKNKTNKEVSQASEDIANVLFKSPLELEQTAPELSMVMGADVHSLEHAAVNFPLLVAAPMFLYLCFAICQLLNKAMRDFEQSQLVQELQWGTPPFRLVKRAQEPSRAQKQYIQGQSRNLVDQAYKKNYECSPCNHF